MTDLPLIFFLILNRGQFLKINENLAFFRQSTFKKSLAQFLSARHISITRNIQISFEWANLKVYSILYCSLKNFPTQTTTLRACNLLWMGSFLVKIHWILNPPHENFTTQPTILKAEISRAYSLAKKWNLLCVLFTCLTRQIF